MINMSDDFAFDAQDYEIQTAEVKRQVHKKCEDLLLGCIMTIFSNRTKSDTYIEARRNQLAGNLGGYATDATSAVRLLLGNEALKKAGSNPRKPSNNIGGDKSAGSGDTSETLAFVGITGPPNDSGESCWNCGAVDHIRYDCPKLSEAQKQTYRDRRDGYKEAGNKTKGDNIKAAVFMHLGNMESDSESDDQDEKQSKSFWDDEESASDGGDEADGEADSEMEQTAYNVFSFCQIAEDNPDDWETASAPGNADDENDDLVDEVEDTIDATLTEPSEAAKLDRVLNAVAIEQNKPSTWVNAVSYKFGKIGIFTVGKLHELLPSLNQRLKIGGYSTFHRITLAGISDELSKSLEADFRRGQA